MKVAGAAALTTNIFTGNLSGANDRVPAAFIGMGRMGQGNLGYAMKQENLVAGRRVRCLPAQPRSGRSRSPGGKAKGLKDFREILADKSIDVVCISTPDHWHAYMTVEACKAGKDVYVEKPVVGNRRRRAQDGARRRASTTAWCRPAPCSARPSISRKPCEIVQERRTRPDHVLSHCWNYSLQPAKASAIRRTAIRPPVSIGTCGSGPRRSVRSTRTASASIQKLSRTSATSGITPAA